MASILEGALHRVARGARFPEPRIERPDAGDAWYRAQRPAELSAPRHTHTAAAPLNHGAATRNDGEARGAESRRGWLARARDRQLSLREHISAEIQVVNARARRYAQALDLRLSQSQGAWCEGDVFFYTRSELRSIIAGGSAPDTRTRREAYEVWEALGHEGVIDVDSMGGPLERQRAMGQRFAGGVPFGSGRIVGRLCILGRGETPSLADAEGAIVLLTEAPPSASSHVLVARALALWGAGPLSHLALLAREHKVPMVASLSGDLSAFHNGQRVCLDLERGTLQPEA